jgi:hypothetical protein
VQDTGTLFKILRKSDNKAADVKLAVAKLPPDYKKKMFTEAFRIALVDRADEEVLLPLLFQCGAEPDAHTLGVAALYSSLLGVKLIHDAGVSFEEAIAAFSWSTAYTDRLKFYQQEMTKPTAEELSPRVQKLFQHMQEQIDDLTRQLETARQPENKPAREKRTYALPQLH